MIHITPRLSIPDDEVTFTASHSSGPGGQNVNKVSTRVTLWFDVAASKSLSETQKERILNEYPGRIDKKGVMRVVSQQTRSQAANRELAAERFAALIRDALKPRRPRRETRVSKAQKERRLEEKKKHGRRKKERASKEIDGY
jgi:ribosome-associated protein